MVCGLNVIICRNACAADGHVHLLSFSWKPLSVLRKEPLTTNYSSMINYYCEIEVEQIIRLAFNRQAMNSGSNKTINFVHTLFMRISNDVIFEGRNNFVGRYLFSKGA